MARRRAGAGEPAVRADARVRRRGGLGGCQGPGVLRGPVRVRLARERGVDRVGRGGSRVLPSEAGVRKGQGAHGPRRVVRRRLLS
jgi:hypothetical protein